MNKIIYFPQIQKSRLMFPDVASWGFSPTKVMTQDEKDPKAKAFEIIEGNQQNENPRVSCEEACASGNIP